MGAGEGELRFFLAANQSFKVPTMPGTTPLNSFTKGKNETHRSPKSPVDAPFRKVSWSGMKKAPEHMAPSSSSLKNQKLEERKHGSGTPEAWRPLHGSTHPAQVMFSP